MHNFISQPNIICPTTPPLSRDFYRHLIQFFQTQPMPDENVSHIWRTMRQYQTGLIKALQDGDVLVLASSLSDMYVNECVAGFDGINGSCSLAFYNQELIETANCLGVLPVFNPHQPNDITNLDHEGLLNAMEVVLGAKLTHSGGGGMEGMVVGDRFITLKLIEAARLFVGLRRMAGDPAAVLEIGAGAGMLGYLIGAMMPQCRYHTIDLPVVSVMQAFLLATAFGEDKIWLAGEKFVGTQRLLIHGQSDIAGDLDAVVMVNVVPELPDERQVCYIIMALCCLKSGGHLLAVNHESNSGGQRRLFDAIQPYKNLKLLSRTPAWGRSGYVQEIYRKV